MQDLHRRDLALVVAVLAAGKRRQLDAEFVGLGLAPSFIFTKNGLVSVLVMRQAEMSCAKPGAGRQRQRGGGSQKPALERS